MSWIERRRHPTGLLAAVTLMGAVAACDTDDGSGMGSQKLATPAEVTTNSVPTMLAPTTTELPTLATRPMVRPPLVNVHATPMVFDEQSGVVVVLVDDDAPGIRTWVLDVASASWTEHASAEFSGGRVRAVYDPEADLTIAMTAGGRTFAYDVDTDEWTQRGDLPASCMSNRCGPTAVAYDQRAQRVVVLIDDPPRLQAWSYSVDDDRWTEIRQSGEVPVDFTPGLAAYVPSIDAVVTFSGSNPSPSGNYEPATTSVFQPETGTWSRVATATPRLEFSFGDLSAGTEMLYAPVTDRVIVFSDGVTAEYDPAQGVWAIFEAPVQESDDTFPVGRLARIDASIVYDPIAARVLMYGGSARMTDGWTLLDDLWAYDPTTHEWSPVLEPTQTVVTDHP